jgi:hypothetical protein
LLQIKKALPNQAGPYYDQTQELRNCCEITNDEVVAAVDRQCNPFFDPYSDLIALHIGATFRTFGYIKFF